MCLCIRLIPLKYKVCQNKIWHTCLLIHYSNRSFYSYFPCFMSCFYIYKFSAFKMDQSDQIHPTLVPPFSHIYFLCQASQSSLLVTCLFRHDQLLYFGTATKSFSGYCTFSHRCVYWPANLIMSALSRSLERITESFYQCVMPFWWAWSEGVLHLRKFDPIATYM